MQRLVETLARELAAAQTGAWDSVSFRTSVVDVHSDSSVLIDRDGQRPRLDAHEPSTSVFWDALAELRAATADPVRGAWFTMTLTVHADGRVETAYDADTEPRFLPPLGPEDYARDFERFPRSLETQPSWLRDRLSWARLTPEQTVQANRGAGALQPEPPPPGGQRHMFTVTVTPENDIEVFDHASGSRAFVDRDGAVRLVDPDPPARPD